MITWPWLETRQSKFSYFSLYVFFFIFFFRLLLVILGCCYGNKILINGLLFKSACQKCKDWYDKEIRDTTWLTELNNEFKCPCTATLRNGQMNVNSRQWKADISCRNPQSSGCKYYHPDAAGCLRSVGTTRRNARQQCCYGADGRLLEPGTPGAGTPDKSANLFGHYFQDVVPYKNCCKECKKSSYCNFYINGVRKGDSSHC